MADHATPAFRFFLELLASGASQGVILRLAVIFGNTPLGGDPAALLEAQQRRIERSLVQLQQVFRDLLDAHSDPEAVHRPHGIERLQHQQIKCSLQDFAFGRRHIFL